MDKNKEMAKADLRLKDSKEAKFKCQFNPSTLRTTYTNQFGDDPPNGHARVTTAKLDVELIFDTTDTGVSVYQQLFALEELTRSKAQKDKDKPDGKVPVVEFWWAIKIFQGVIESLTHTIDYWSYDGVPLRATVQLSLKETNHSLTEHDKRTASRKSNEVSINNQADNVAAIEPPSGPKGTTDVATKAGNSSAGRTIAAQNGLESMRGGANASASASANASASASASATASASASASVVGALSVSASAKLGAAASFKMSGGISAGAGAGASLGFGLGASAGASASAGIGAAAGIGLSGGAAIGGGAGIGIGGGVSIGASAGAGFSAGASAGAGVSFGAGASAGAFAGASGSASAGVSASAGAFAGLGSSKMITGNTGMDIAKLLPPPMPMPMGSSAQFDATGKMVNNGSVVVASSYSTQTTSLDGTTTRTSGGSVRVM